MADPSDPDPSSLDLTAGRGLSMISSAVARHRGSTLPLPMTIDDAREAVGRHTVSPLPAAALDGMKGIIAEAEARVDRGGQT